MDPAQRFLKQLGDALAGTSPYAPLVLFFGSFVEYVFPPFPGDTVVVLGSWYAVRGALSWPITFLSVTAGAVAGSAVDYWLGAWLGRRLEKGAARTGPLTAARVARVEESYRRWGDWFLLANRFLPGVPGFLFVAAGAARIPLRRVLLFGGISAAVWNALLLAAGALLVSNLEELVRLVQRYTVAVSVLMAVVVALWIVRAWSRKRRDGGEGR